MDVNLINLYIERLLKELNELTKTKVLLQTQLEYTESLNALLTKQIEELKQTVDKYQSSEQKRKKKSELQEASLSSDNL